MRSLRHPRGHTTDTGAAAVEMALLTPLLVLFVSGIIVFGLNLWSIQSANFGAREGARLAAVGVNNCATWTQYTTAKSGIAVPTSLTLAYKKADGVTAEPNPTPGSTVVVTLTYNNINGANSLLNAATAMFGSALQVPTTGQATASARAEVIGSQLSC